MDKDILKLKGKGKKVIFPLDIGDGRIWDEPNDDDANVRSLYQVMQNNEDIIEPNNNGEIHPGYPMSVRQNSDLELYNWKIENYEV